MDLRVSGYMLLISAIVMGGCGYTSKSNPPAVNPGSSLQINNHFSALRNGSYIYFQNGTNLPEKKLDKWSTYCALYVYNSEFGADYMTSVEPGNFQVSRSSNSREVVDIRDQNLSGTKLAGLVRWSAYDHPSYILYNTRLYLWSAEQPDVKSLTCSRKAGNYGDYYPRFEQMKVALGDLIQINR